MTASSRLANKSDTDRAVDEAEIIETLDLDELVNKHQCPCRLERCCALLRRPGYRGLDKPIRVGLRWLLNYIDSQWLVLQDRTRHDTQAQTTGQAAEVVNRLECDLLATDEQELNQLDSEPIKERAAGDASGGEQALTDFELDPCCATADRIAQLTMIDLEARDNAPSRGENGTTELSVNPEIKENRTTVKPVITNPVPTLLNFQTIREQIELACQVTENDEETEFCQKSSGKTYTSGEDKKLTKDDDVVRRTKKNGANKRVVVIPTTRRSNEISRKSAPTQRKLQSRISDPKFHSFGRPPVNRPSGSDVSRSQCSGPRKVQNPQRLKETASVGSKRDKTARTVGLAPITINPIYPRQPNQRQLNYPSTGLLIMPSPKKAARPTSISRLLNPGINKLHPSHIPTYTRAGGAGHQEKQRSVSFNYNKYNF